MNPHPHSYHQPHLSVRDADRMASLIRAEFAYARAQAISDQQAKEVREIRDVPYCADIVEEPREPMRCRDAWGLLLIDIACWTVIFGGLWFVMWL